MCRHVEITNFCLSFLLFHFCFSFSQQPKEKQSNTDVLPLTQEDNTSLPSSSIKKQKKKHLSEEQRLLTDMSDERLQVYGLNPKRFRNFVRFNKDKKNE